MPLSDTSIIALLTAFKAAPPSDQSIATSHTCSENSLRPLLYAVFGVGGISALGIIAALIFASLRLIHPRG